MAAADGFTSISDLKAFKTTWKIRVKIVHTWRQYTTYTGETIEMVLSDSAGSLIHATVKKQQLNKFQRLIVFGEWRIIENFQLSSASGKFRATNHPYEMSIMNSTTITRCPSLSDDFYLDLASYNNIIAEDGLNEHFLIDVVGQVVTVGEMKTSELNDKPRKRLEISLRDTSDQRLTCTLWGKFADNMWKACNDANESMVICLIRCAKINTYNGERTISNAFDMSLMLINPDYKPVRDFVENLPKDDLKLTFVDKNCSSKKQSHEKDDYINQFPRSKISDLLEAQIEGKFKILCTIYHIDMEFGWYYFTCVKCKGTCFLIPKKENEIVTKNKKNWFECKTCNQDVSKVICRYKVVLDVMDDTGETKFILFDTNAIKVVNQSSIDVLGGQYDEIRDPTIVPPALQALVGKTFLFLASVETANIVEGKVTYKISYVEMGDNTTNVDNTEDSEVQVDPRDLISNEIQGHDSLTNSSDNGTSMSTPSSKRKEDSTEDGSAQSSTSKKMCLPSIKEVIEDAVEKVPVNEGLEA